MTGECAHQRLVCTLRLPFCPRDFDQGVRLCLPTLQGYVSLQVSAEVSADQLASGGDPGLEHRAWPPWLCWGRWELTSSLSLHAQGGLGITRLLGTVSSWQTRLPRSEKLSNMLANLVLSNILENPVVWAFCVFSSAKTSLLPSLLLCLL